MIRELIVALLLVAIAAFALQGPKLIPPFEGDGNEQHANQPKFCVNNDTKEYLHNCDCQPRMGDAACHDPDKGGENPKCSVWCRPKACRCIRECGKTE